MHPIQGTRIEEQLFFAQWAMTRKLCGTDDLGRFAKNGEQFVKENGFGGEPCFTSATTQS